MFFKSLRSRSKSSSKSTKPSTLARILSSSSSHHPTACSKIPEVVVSPPLSPGTEPGNIFHEEGQDGMAAKKGAKGEESDREADGKDYEEFLEKARKDIEKERKAEEKKAKKARELTMSPWASRMNC